MKPTSKFLHLLYFPYIWLVFAPFFFLNTILFGILAVILATIVNKRIASYYGGVVWSRINAYAVPMFPNVIGRKNIKPGTSYVIIANHQSLFDIFLIYGWMCMDIKWVMKKELKNFPGLGFGAKRVGHIFLDRSNPRAAVKSLEDAKKILIDGTSVVFFPEGTRSKDGNIGLFKRGGFKMAIDLQLSILPVTLVDTKYILPADSTSLFPGKVKMIIHPPVDIKEYREDQMHELMDHVKQIIAQGLE